MVRRPLHERTGRHQSASRSAFSAAAAPPPPCARKRALQAALSPRFPSAAGRLGAQERPHQVVEDGVVACSQRAA
eukprot:scaffold790_cov387-Prasinococcus_capsulatus_cf.AAC.1